MKSRHLFAVSLLALVVALAGCGPIKRMFAGKDNL